jgi:thymidylate kinase
MFIPGEYVVTILDPKKQLVFDEVHIDFSERKENQYVYKVLVNFSSENNFLPESYDFILDFSAKGISDLTSKKYYFINNPDKTIRWIFPSDLKTPTFLRFYNTSSFKANVLSALLKAAFALNMKKAVCSGSFRMYYKHALKIESVLKNIPHDNYSLFTGTVGPNRKFVIELNTQRLTTHFAKWAISNTSKILAANERMNIEKIKKLQLNYMEVPEYVYSSDDSVYIYKNIKPQNLIPAKGLTDIHLKALSELYEKSITYNLSGITTFREHLITAIYSLKPDARIADSENMIELLRKSLDVLDFETAIPCSLAHFDFTPWNMYATADKLYVYDWELSDKIAPILFDVFHYIFQKNILVDRTDLVEIKKQIHQTLENPILKDVINRYNINVELCYKAYLLHTISYYLSVYGQQKSLHVQVQWLVGVWYKALEEIFIKKSYGSQRKSFITHLFTFLNKYEYALMKFSEASISDVEDSSDLDILIHKQDLNAVLAYLKETGALKKIRIIKKSFMTTAHLFFEDGSFLSIDLLYVFKRKAKIILSASTVLKETGATNQGIKIPKKLYDFEYMLLFYQLNGSDLPKKYMAYFESLTANEKMEILHHLQRKFNLLDYSANEIFAYSDAISNKIIRVVDEKIENKGISRLASVFDYCIDTIKDIIMNKGLIVTVSGVDGAGKSTIIEDLKNNFVQKFRKKVVVIRHRPSIFPILSAWKYGKTKAESMAAERLPRQGTNTSSILSLLRFLYYYSDYLFGQVYVYMKYVLRGYIVIYDRYYFDFIGDSKRSNLKLNTKVVTWLYTFIYKPELNVLLYAAPEMILKRKQELTKEDIQQLTHDYRFLFNKLSVSNDSSKYISIDNVNRSETLDIIIKEFIKIS